MGNSVVPENAPVERIHILDALRGLAVVAMVVYHFMYDLAAFYYIDAMILPDALMEVLHFVFSSLFILISGISSRYSRSNLKRGAKLLALALSITLVTSPVTSLTETELQIRFGILHFLGVSMILFGVLRRYLDLLPFWAAPLVWISLFVASRLILPGIEVKVDFLFPIGLVGPGFQSADYYPLFPWLFMFLLGTWLGLSIKKGRFPQAFYSARCAPLEWIGRHALVIYLLHQPVLLGLIWLYTGIPPF